MVSHLSCAFIAAVVLAAATACGSKLDPVQTPTTGADCPEVTDVTYGATIEPLIVTHCTSCHTESLVGSARKGAPSAVNLDSHASVASWKDRVATRVTAGTMPPTSEPPVPRCDAALIVHWVDNGAPGP